MVWRIFVKNTIPEEIGFLGGSHALNGLSPISEIEDFLPKCILAISHTSTTDGNCVLDMKYISFSRRFGSHWTTERISQYCMVISRWKVVAGHLKLPDVSLFVSLCLLMFPYLSVVGCISPACTSTVFRWSTSRRSLWCCRSHRKSSSAWRPYSSSASVSLLLCLCVYVYTQIFLQESSWIITPRVRFVGVGVGGMYPCLSKKKKSPTCEASYSINHQQSI